MSKDQPSGDLFLILSNSQDETANYLGNRFLENRKEFLRIDSDRFIQDWKLSFSDGIPILKRDNRPFSPFDIKNVWYRRPRPVSLPDICADEAPKMRQVFGEWEEALENFLAFIPMDSWINHPTLNYQASHKLLQLEAAKKLGFKVPESLVTTQPNEFEDFYLKHNKNVIVKPLRSGFIEYSESQVGLIYTSFVKPEHASNAELIKQCPSYFQEAFVRKKDIRVTILDTNITAVELVDNSSDHLDIRRNNMKNVEYSPYSLTESTKDRLLRYMKFFNLRFAAIDLLETEEGEIVFLEINPNGQWAWLDVVGCSRIFENFLEV